MQFESRCKCWLQSCPWECESLQLHTPHSSSSLVTCYCPPYAVAAAALVTGCNKKKNSLGHNSYHIDFEFSYNKLKTHSVMMTIQHVCRNGNDDIREDRDKKNWHVPSWYLPRFPLTLKQFYEKLFMGYFSTPYCIFRRAFHLALQSPLICAALCCWLARWFEENKKPLINNKTVLPVIQIVYVTPGGEYLQWLAVIQIQFILYNDQTWLAEIGPAKV